MIPKLDRGTRPSVYLRVRPKTPWSNLLSEQRMAKHSHLILCVDDELVGLRVRKLLLERAGYKVLTALDGPTGLEIFKTEPIDAVVLDYAMPGMHGGEVAGLMRQVKPKVPILLLSAYIGLPAEVTSLVNLYMTKGEGAPVLLKKLGSLLQPTVTR